MSTAQDYDVDERISTIKSSLKRIQSSFLGESSSSYIPDISQANSQYSIKTPEPNEKYPPENIDNTTTTKPNSNYHTPYVSNYVAFGGNSKEENSSFSDTQSPKRQDYIQTMDPTSSSWYPKKLSIDEVEIDNFPELSKVEQEIAHKQDQIDELLGWKSEIIKKIEKYEDEIANKNDLIAELKGELFEANLQVKTLKAKNEAILREIEESSMRDSGRLDKSDLKNRIAELEKARVDYMQEKEEIQEELQRKSAKINVLEQNYLTVKKERNYFADKSKDLETKLTAISIENSEIKRKLSLHSTLSLKKLKTIDKNIPIKKGLKTLKGTEKLYWHKELEGTNEHKERLNSPRALSKQKKSPQKELTGTFMRKIIGQLMVILKVEHANELVEACTNAVKDAKLSHDAQKFHKKISSLIVKYSPPNSVEKPSLNRVYKWIRRLIEEYLLIKKQQENTQKHTQIIQMLMKMLNVNFPEDILTELKRIMN
ncbi:unnamed protein product [Blepharisma stoltei]|uniref:GRIP domain-containing protein n=1 Tax=Blepharisma stoltei TaxID=1481888 RepID=A0AAU9IQZ0_9CILI|nr:unnamed protein product [Blepharisma stoltei]